MCVCGGGVVPGKAEETCLLLAVIILSPPLPFLSSHSASTWAARTEVTGSSLDRGIRSTVCTLNSLRHFSTVKPRLPSSDLSSLDC